MALWSVLRARMTVWVQAYPKQQEGAASLRGSHRCHSASGCPRQEEEREVITSTLLLPAALCAWSLSFVSRRYIRGPPSASLHGSFGKWGFSFSSLCSGSRQREDREWICCVGHSAMCSILWIRVVIIIVKIIVICTETLLCVCWSFIGPEPGGPESMMREWKKERG